jgi:hypothetical protein
LRTGRPAKPPAGLSPAPVLFEIIEESQIITLHAPRSRIAAHARALCSNAIIAARTIKQKNLRASEHTNVILV